MANRLQKFLFNLSTFSPLAFFYALVWWMQTGAPALVSGDGKLHLSGPAIGFALLALGSFGFSFYCLWFVKKCRKNLESIPIQVSGVSPQDSWVVGVLLSYVLPFAKMLIGELNPLLFFPLLAIFLWVLWRSNTVYPNPILMLGAYHFYLLSNADGGEAFHLLSKRKSIHNKDSVRRVLCPFDYFLIEKEESHVF